MLENYPLIQYGGVNMVDITRRIVIHEEIKDQDTLFRSYIVKDGELPEDIAFNFYGKSEYNMIVLLVNNIIDPFYGWVLSSVEFEEFVRDKYGVDKVRDIHHHELNGEIVHSTVVGATPVSNYDYEFKLNEKKRRIKILKPVYISAFLDEYNKAINAEIGI